jgi:hypothetical protein
MARFDILFETDRFNVSQVKEHFINPCCSEKTQPNGWVKS